MTKINWHRLFGLALIDLFNDSDYQVELEKELSLKKQYLDIVIIKKTAATLCQEYPVGLDNLTEHNLLTYKSLREPLDEWAIEELIGHYTNYRKLVSPSLHDLLPVQQFQLYAISTRYPSHLLKKLSFQEVYPGVFDLTWGIRVIRLIVLNRVSLAERNAFWLLFGGKAQLFEYGNHHYHWHCASERAVLNQLYELYQKEGVIMPYTMEDFERDFTEEHLHLLSPETIFSRFSPEQRLKGLPPEERLKGLSTEEILKRLPSEVIETYLSELKNQD